MPMSRRLVALAAGTTVALSACAGTPVPVATVTVSSTPTAIAESQAPPVASPEESTPEATESQATSEPVAETFVMPKVVGMNLQTAQDLLQSKGSYLMDQQDASGLGRFQIDDSNWRVCTQNPKAGTKAPIETIVVLAAVKLSERCP